LDTPQKSQSSGTQRNEHTMNCVNPECDLPAFEGQTSCRWESCEEYAAQVEKAGDFRRVGRIPRPARALLNRLRTLRGAQRPYDTPTPPMRKMYREAFALLREENPRTSYVAIQSHINHHINARRA
jgi:hypothetical protein